MLPSPYVGSYSGERGHPFLQEKWMISLEKSVEIFVMVSISDIPTIKYWYNLGTIMDTAKEKTPKQYSIGDTCLRHWKLLEGIYSRDTQKILIMYTKTVMIFCQ